MNLRFPLLALVAAVLMAGTAEATPKVQGRQLTIGADDVQKYLDGSFPRSQDALGGLLALTVSQPQLTLPAGSRLNLQFDLAMATAGGSPVPVGNVALSSALRYDSQTHGFHLQDPSVDDFRPAHSGGKVDSRTRGLVNAWLADYARREPIYRIDPALANVLGALQVKSVAIQNGRLAVDFNQDISNLVPVGLFGK